MRNNPYRDNSAANRDVRAPVLSYQRRGRITSRANRQTKVAGKVNSVMRKAAQRALSTFCLIALLAKGGMALAQPEPAERSECPLADRSSREYGLSLQFNF